jgi:hypothetical protein
VRTAEEHGREPEQAVDYVPAKVFAWWGVYGRRSSGEGARAGDRPRTAAV